MRLSTKHLQGSVRGEESGLRVRFLGLISDGYAVKPSLAGYHLKPWYADQIQVSVTKRSSAHLARCWVSATIPIRALYGGSTLNSPRESVNVAV